MIEFQLILTYLFLPFSVCRKPYSWDSSMSVKMKTLFWNYRTKSRRCNRRLGLAKSLFCNDLHVCYYHSNYLRQVLIDWFSFSWLYTITLVVISFTEIDSRLACNAKGLKFFCPRIWKVITGIWNQILAQIFCIMLKEISEIHILHTICSWHKDVPVRPKVIWLKSQSHHQHGILCRVHTVLIKKYKKFIYGVDKGCSWH